MTRIYTNTPEAAEKRAARRALRRSQADDPLAQRERSIAFWKESAQTNAAYLPYRGAWWHPFVVQTWGRRLLMPGVRALLDRHDADRKRQLAAELRDWCERNAASKALAAAARKRAAEPQGQMFEETTT